MAKKFESLFFWFSSSFFSFYTSLRSEELRFSGRSSGGNGHLIPKNIQYLIFSVNILFSFFQYCRKKKGLDCRVRFEIFNANVANVLLLLKKKKKNKKKTHKKKEKQKKKTKKRKKISRMLVPMHKVR